MVKTHGSMSCCPKGWCTNRGYIDRKKNNVILHETNFLKRVQLDPVVTAAGVAEEEHFNGEKIH